MADLLSRWKLRRCSSVGHGATVRGTVWIHGRGMVRLGQGVVLDGAAAPIELHAVEPESVIELGDGAVLCGGSSIEAVESVKLGARTRLGPYGKVLDNHFHPLTGNRNLRPPSAPVEIGAEVEIGPHARVLAGARIGAGATVCAGSVVARRLEVPAGASARGIPAVIE